MKQAVLLFGVITLLLDSCKTDNNVKSELAKLIKEWNYVLPLPTDIR